MVHPTFDAPVGLVCETYKTTSINKAGNFGVPVDETKFEETVTMDKKASNITPVMVWQVLKTRRKTDPVTRKRYLVGY